MSWCMSCHGFEACRHGSSSVAVRAPRVNGGGVIAAGLANQLVEAMTEVLHLAGAQHAADTHQLRVPVVRVCMVPARPRVGMATTSPLGLCVLSTRQKRVVVVEADVGGYARLGEGGTPDEQRPPEGRAVQRGQGGRGIGGGSRVGRGGIGEEGLAALHLLKGSAQEKVQAEGREGRGEERRDK